MDTYRPGTLWQQITERTLAALDGGLLHPIGTHCEFIEDRSVRFLVRIVDDAKSRERQTPARAGFGSSRNPFLPFDPAMHVVDVSPTHICLLNKFNVVPHHVLVVTREFEEQQAPLSAQDFAALWQCLAEFEALGFYNAGTVAGASQPHKHLQIVPLPLAAPGPRVPIEPLLDAGRPGHNTEPALATIDLPFAHVVARFDPVADAPAGIAARAMETLRLYHEMLRRVGLNPSLRSGGTILPPYNLLVTCRWMLLVPRRCETFAGISVNALAFAGALLARDQQQFEILKAAGPMAALAAVACAKTNTD